MNNITINPSPENILFILRSSSSAYFLLEPQLGRKFSLLMTTAIPRTSCRKSYSLGSNTSFLFNSMRFCNSSYKNLEKICSLAMKRFQNIYKQFSVDFAHIIKAFESKYTLISMYICQLAYLLKDCSIWPSFTLNIKRNYDIYKTKSDYGI